MVKGFPTKKKTSSRGDIWQVDTRDGIQWIVEQEAPKCRPRAPAKPDFSDAPPGWEAFRAVEELGSPVEQGSMTTALCLLYCLPRLTVLVASEYGLGMDALFRLSGHLLLTLEEMCRRLMPFWPQDADDMPLLQSGFEPVNWPWLAKRAGEPDWTPPSHALCWVELDVEERRLSIAKGEAEAAGREHDAAA